MLPSACEIGRRSMANKKSKKAKEHVKKKPKGLLSGIKDMIKKAKKFNKQMESLGPKKKKK